jgi:hypothetical protein
MSWPTNAEGLPGDATAMPGGALGDALGRLREAVKHRFSSVASPAAFVVVNVADLLAVLDAAEVEHARQEKYDADVKAFGEAWAAAPRDRGVRIMPDGALAWRNRTSEERRAYLTEHRDEALEYGIPANLIDLMIADAEGAGDE